MTLEDKIEKKLSEGSDIQELDFRKILADIEKRTILDISRMDGKFPYYGRGKEYILTDNRTWVSGYWTAWLWRMYQVTGNESFRETASLHYEGYSHRFNTKDIHCHDVGVIYDLAAVTGYKVTGEDRWRHLALRAASALSTRFITPGNYLQAWGPAFSEDPHFARTIIDSLCCIPLWFWASKETGDEYFRNLAALQAETVLKRLVMEDWSSGHSHTFEPGSGKPIRIEAVQGKGNDSTWSRGESWGIMGFAEAYENTGDERFLDAALNMLTWWLDHTDSSMVPPWDFDVPEENVDTSALTIAINGMLRLAGIEKLDAHLREELKKLAIHSMKNLIARYGTFDDESQWGLLKGGVYSYPENRGVDEFMIWGDYYFIVDLMLLLGYES